jgi:hypothetical protein
MQDLVGEAHRGSGIGSRILSFSYGVLVDTRDRLECVGGSRILSFSYGVLVDTRDRLECVGGSPILGSSHGVLVGTRDRLDCVKDSPILGSSHGVLVDKQDRLECVEGNFCSVAVRGELDHLTVFRPEAENGQDTCRIHRLPTRQPYPYWDRLPGRGPDEYGGRPGVQANSGGNFHSPHCGHVHFPDSCDSAGGVAGPIIADWSGPLPVCRPHKGNQTTSSISRPAHRFAAR